MTELERALVEYDGDNTKPFCDLVYKALKEMQNAEKGCPYCSAPYNFNCTIRTQQFNDGAILAIFCGENQPYMHASCYPNKGDATHYSFAAKIKFCPMCGRKLEG